MMALTAPFLAWTATSATPLLHAAAATHSCSSHQARWRRVAAAPRSDEASSGAPTLREQMMAYIKSVQERGVELTEDQKAMIAEFEADDELLDQTGRPDFMKGATVVSAEEYEAQQAADSVATAAPTAPAAPAAPVPAAAPPAPVPAAAVVAVAAAPVAAPVDAGPVDPATARLWMMQRGEMDAACALLQQRADGGGLQATEAKELRKHLASLLCTLASAP